MEALEMFAAIFYILISIVIVVGNLTVILSVISIKVLRTISNILLVSLSFADLSVGVIALPLRLSEVFESNWTTTIDYCRISHCFTLLTLTASILNLAIISIDRYFAINKPFVYIRITQNFPFRYAGGLISTAWIIAIVITFLPLYGWGSNGETGNRKKKGICTFNETLEKDFIYIILVAVVGISVVVVLSIYLKIYLIVRSHLARVVPIIRGSQRNTSIGLDNTVKLDTPSIVVEKNSSPKLNEGTIDTTKNQTPTPQVVPENSTSSNQLIPERLTMQRNSTISQQFTAAATDKKKAFMRSWKAAKTMFIVVICFCIAWTAFIVPTSIFLRCKECASPPVILISVIILFSGSAVNPFIYFTKLKVFRREVKKAVMRKFSHR